MKSAHNSSIKTCIDIDVNHPSATNAKGNPAIKVSGASTGKTYHHLVNVPNEIIVSGNIRPHVNRFIVTFWMFVLSDAQRLRLHAGRLPKI
jgi:hypothetical protein